MAVLPEDENDDLAGSGKRFEPCARLAVEVRNGKDVVSAVKMMSVVTEDRSDSLNVRILV